MKRCVLFLNDNALPVQFTKGTVSAKELRLRAAIPQIDEVHVIAPIGSYVSSHIQAVSKLEEKIIVHHFPSFPYYFRSFPLFFYGLYWAKKVHPISVEAESPHISGPAAILIGNLVGIPAIIEVRTTLSKLIHHRLKWLPLFLKKRLLQIVEAWSYDHASIIIANSRTYQSRLKMRGYQSTVINPGLQLHQIPQLPKSIPRDKKRFVIGYLGRLVPEKGVHLLIEAVELLVSEPGLPVFHVEIAGEGEERLKLEQLVSQYHLEHCVSFLGQVENVSVLTHWDILVNPCLVNAPIEMVNAEAAFLGVPVICFGNLVYPETVVHQKTGLKVLPKTPIVLKNAIKSLLTNIDLISTLKKNGPAFASTHYRFQDQVKKLESLYQKHNLID